MTSRIMLVDGTADKINPYQGGEVSLFGVKHVGTCISAADTAKYFLIINNMGDAPEVTDLFTNATDESLPVKVQSWRLLGRAFIELYSIKNGGHVIPQPFYRFPRIMGKTSANFNAPEKAIEFFNIIKHPIL